MTHEFRESPADARFRESPADARYCGACGQPYALCRGTKPFDLAFLKEHPEGAPDAGEWDRWCARYGVDPNTPDERFMDAFLHGRTPKMTMVKPSLETLFDANGLLRPGWVRVREGCYSQVNLRWRDDAQRAWYAACDAFSEAYRRMPHTTRRLQDRAEVVELERLWRLS